MSYITLGKEEKKLIFLCSAQDLARKDTKGFSQCLSMSLENSKLDFKSIFGFDEETAIRKQDQSHADSSEEVDRRSEGKRVCMLSK
ncbi:MAG: hypothetical protein NPINA01_22670 [Nitrospinaceae bacterium]|nr:MAG: hypothetical protein NPINA01_22670 [Nitrospinaceae bacterium]